MNGYVNEVIRLYFKGYTVAEAIKIVKGDMKVEALEKAIENYERGKKEVELKRHRIENNIKVSGVKESRGWKYQELKFDVRSKGE